MGRNKIWRKEDIEDLKKSFELISEEAKQANKPLSEMMNKLQNCLKVKRNKSVIIDKLLSIDLIQSRSDLKPMKQKNKTSNEIEENFIEDDDSDQEIEKKSEKPKKKEKSKKKKKKRNEKMTIYSMPSPEVVVTRLIRLHPSPSQSLIKVIEKRPMEK